MNSISRRDRSGFTLIELLLVLAILAMLSALIVPKFANRSKQAKLTAASTEISRIETSIDAFEIDVARYPTTSEGLKSLKGQPANSDGWMGPYLKMSKPTDPWGNEYSYRQPGQHNKYGYDLSSDGPDGISGNEDDITNWSEEDD